MDLTIFKQLVSAKLNIDTTAIVMETNLTNDLGIDSIDMMDVIMAIENKYNIRLDDSKIQELKTVNDLLTYVNQLIAK